MGIEVAIAITAATAAVGAASSYVANRAQGKAADAQKEASNVASAQQKQQEMDARRNAYRQQRIKAAQISQGAANTGTQMSSGEIGSLSALSTNAGTQLASLAGADLSNQGIASANQSYADNLGKASTWSSIGQISSAIGTFGSAAAEKLGTNAAKGTGWESAGGSGKVSSDVNNTILNNPDLF